MPKKPTSAKPSPTLIVGHFENFLKNIQNKIDKKEIQDLIQREGILEVLPCSVQRLQTQFEVYVVTKHASIIKLIYDTRL